MLNRRRAVTTAFLLQALESRVLMAGTPTFVLNEIETALLGTLSSKQLIIPADGLAGPSLQAEILWGDGKRSAATLTRAASGKIQVWGSHAYDTLKAPRIQVVTWTENEVPKVSLTATGTILLNDQTSRTLNFVAGHDTPLTVATIAGNRTFAGAYGTKIILPPNTDFAGFNSGNDQAEAMLRIDWGDGTVSNGFFQSTAGGKYNLTGQHSYADAGSYRVLVNIVLWRSDGTFLHMESLNSTAHVAATSNQRTSFGLPAHQKISIAGVLPVGTTFQIDTWDAGALATNSNAAAPSTSQTLDGVGNNYSGFFTSGSVFRIQAGPQALTLTGIASNDGSSLTFNGSTAGSIFLGSIADSLGAALHGSLTLAYGAIAPGTVTLAVGAGSLTLLAPSASVFPPAGGIVSQTYSSTSNSVITVSTTGSTVTPLITTGDWSVFGNDILSRQYPMLTAPSNEILPLLTGNFLVFYGGSESASVISDLGKLNPEFTGIIYVFFPTAGLDLPPLPNATIITITGGTPVQGGFSLIL